MNTEIPRPPKVEMDFTDAQLTGFGGWSAPGRMAERLNLPRALSALSVKQRARGASEAETLCSLIASLAAGNGAPSDPDALREDRVGQRLPGLGHVPSGRRPGEYLARIDEAQVETLLEVARSLAAQVGPAVVEHEAVVRGYVPVFIDGIAIEVDGKLFEEARRGYDGTRQHWLHGVFIGSLWASGRLHPGGGDVSGGWREQLDSDAATCLPEGAPVWLRADTPAMNRRAAKPRAGNRADAPCGSEQDALVGQLRICSGLGRFRRFRTPGCERRRTGSGIVRFDMPAVRAGGRSGAGPFLPADFGEHTPSGIGQGRNPVRHSGRTGAGRSRFGKQRRHAPQRLQHLALLHAAERRQQSRIRAGFRQHETDEVARDRQSALPRPFMDSCPLLVRGRNRQPHPLRRRRAIPVRSFPTVPTAGSGTGRLQGTGVLRPVRQTAHKRHNHPETVEQLRRLLRREPRNGAVGHVVMHEVEHQAGDGQPRSRSSRPDRRPLFPH